MTPPAAPAFGTVYLVGAGPGDPGLLTVRAHELLRDCDCIVYDALANPALVERAALARQGECKRGTEGGPEPAPELYDVGKRGGRPSARQGEITALLVRLARAGKRVVRLKGGDPLVFGRGSEEAQALARAGIPFEIIPGITAGIAAPAYAGIPVTHRGIATSVTFVTGHEDPAKDETDTAWEGLARAGGTLVLYMGVGRLRSITAALQRAGLAGDTPAALIEWGTYARQRTVTATLATLAAAGEAHGIGAPAIAVIGRVVQLRGEIAWFDRRPLSGRRIVVTRAREQASTLRAALEALGAEVLEAPAVRVQPLDPAPLRAALARLGDYRWVVLTSANAVRILWDTLRACALDARALAGVMLAAVGPATGEALLDRGLAPDVVPERHTAEGLADALARRRDVRGARVLFPKAEQARELLPAALREMGAMVDEVAVYRTVPDLATAGAATEALRAGRVSLITFTSSSTVRYFVEAVGVEAARLAPVASIGPATSETARALGLELATEAREATVAGLVQAVVELMAGAPGAVDSSP